MKALILSAGAGTRLRPFSHSMPKQLIPVGNTPVLEHVVSNIRALGVTQIGIIVGDRAREIEAVLGDGSRLQVEITYIPQDEPLGLAHCVLIARDFLGDDDFVMYLGDNMLLDGIVDYAEAFRSSRSAAHLLVHKVSDPREFGVVELGVDGVVHRLVEKAADPPSDLAIIGVYFFTPAIHEAVAAVEPSERGELEITHAIQWLVSTGAVVHATEYDGYWKDTGRVEDVLECNRTVLESIAGSVDGEVDGASVLVGAVVVEPGARVIRSRIEGPVIIGAGSLVEESHVRPYTSIGRDCVLRGSDIGYSIALDDAAVFDMPGLHGSVVGRAAMVRTADRGVVSSRLIVGDHSRVEVVTGC